VRPWSSLGVPPGRRTGHAKLGGTQSETDVGGAEHLLSIESEPSPGVVSLTRCIEQRRKLKAIAVVEGAWYAMPSVSVQGEALGRMLVERGRSSPTQQGW
jgi:hypothetical protein